MTQEKRKRVSSNKMQLLYGKFLYSNVTEATENLKALFNSR